MNVVTQIDLDACAREPIRVPGGIQPHGCLVVVDPKELTVLQASVNARALLGLEGPGQSAAPLLDKVIRDWVAGEDATILRDCKVGGQSFHLIGHKSKQGITLEFEVPPDSEKEGLDRIYPRLQRFADNIVGLDSIAALGELAAREVRAITGFNRVMVYSFDPEWHGTVVAETRDNALPSYLDLRFPASDIPAQARELYRITPLRIIPDANYAAVPIEPVLSPVDGQPLDLSFAGLRSVSPVHLEYMRNMGTLASMSVSIIVEDKLWGLISCHHQTPRRISPEVRSACNFIAKILSLQIASHQRGAYGAERIRLKSRETDLVARLSRASSIQTGLSENATLWLDLTGASGAAVLIDGAVSTVGITPQPEQIRAIAASLQKRPDRDLFSTDFLSRDFPEAQTFAAQASGVIAASISRLHPSYVMWFRPEVVRTVSWGGAPNKPVSPGETRLHPRKSFEQWRELVRNRAMPWSEAQRQSARDFRDVLLNIVLLQAEERAQLTEELQRSNKELEAFSYSISHDLRAPFRHIVGYAELLSARERIMDEKSRHYLNSIIDAALSAGELVDDLLSFSQLGRASLAASRVDISKLIQEIQRSIEQDLSSRNIEWAVGPLPFAWGDSGLLRQAFSNLIENALKYSSGRDPARISINGWETSEHTIYEIRDNGVGFDMAYVDKLFGVFQRLHRAEEFEGTGIGLALTKRVIDRHGGWIRAEGRLDEGATFTLGLPRRPKELKNA